MTKPYCLFIGAHWTWDRRDTPKGIAKVLYGVACMKITERKVTDAKERQTHPLHDGTL